MKRCVKVDEVQKGDLILVAWDDASELKGTLSEHEADPVLVCKDWGVFLGIGGTSRKFLLLGKDVAEVHNTWGAARIPLELVRYILLMLPRSEMLEYIKEIQVLGRRVKLRRHRRDETYVA